MRQAHGFGNAGWSFTPPCSILALQLISLANSVFRVRLSQKSRHFTNVLALPVLKQLDLAADGMSISQGRRSRVSDTVS